MRIFIVETSRGTKLFYSDDKLTQFLSSEELNKKNLSSIRITELEAEVKSESNGQKYLDDVKSQLSRDTKIDSALGDKLSELVEQFRTVILNCNRQPIQRDSFLKKLDITPRTKSDISKLFRGWNQYLLYEAEDSVEYYKLLLQIYKYKSISEKFVREIYNQNGYLHSRGYCKTRPECITNFNLAKRFILENKI